MVRVLKNPAQYTPRTPIPPTVTALVNNVIGTKTAVDETASYIVVDVDVEAAPAGLVTPPETS